MLLEETRGLGPDAPLWLMYRLVVWVRKYQSLALKVPPPDPCIWEGVGLVCQHVNATCGGRTCNDRSVFAL